MLKVKQTAKLKGLKAEMIPALIVAIDSYAIYGYDCVVTDGTGPSHSEGSLHFVGLALDFRMNDVHEIDRGKIVYRIKKYLSNEYDVVLEQFASNPANDHLHIEFDPK